MTTEIDFSSKTDADDFREEHAEHIHETDDRRTRAVVFVDDAPEWVMDRAGSAAFVGAAEDTSLPGEQVPLTDDERDSLESQHDTWNWREHGFEAMRAKGALQAQGATEWMDFYEPGEGAAGALQNLQTSKERSAETGASIGVGGGHRERDADDPAAMQEQAGAVASAAGEECSHAEDHCRHGDPDACEFLGEACGFDEPEIEAIMGASDETAPEDVETPFSGAQLGALRRSWQGYQGALRALESALERVSVAEQHATEAIEAINSIRATAGQEPLEPRRLAEIREMDMADVCDGSDRTPGEVIQMDEQRDLTGARSDPQAMLAGGETGERGQGETEEVVEENPGGMLSDERERRESGETEQHVPEAFAVPEGGQDTL